MLQGGTVEKKVSSGEAGESPTDRQGGCLPVLCDRRLLWTI